jgi:hypothetical protein
MPNWAGRIADFFVSTDSNFDDLDVLARNGPGTQIPVLHEMGHYLGLNHVAGMFNFSSDYGSGYQGQDIMGSGMRLEAWHAFPWRTRLQTGHLGHSYAVEWQAMTMRPSPRTYSSYATPQSGREDPLPGGVRDRDGGVW